MVCSGRRTTRCTGKSPTASPHPADMERTQIKAVNNRPRRIGIEFTIFPFPRQLFAAARFRNLRLCSAAASPIFPGLRSGSGEGRAGSRVIAFADPVKSSPSRLPRKRRSSGIHLQLGQAARLPRKAQRSKTRAVSSMPRCRMMTGRFSVSRQLFPSRRPVLKAVSPRAIEICHAAHHVRCRDCGARTVRLIPARSWRCVERDHPSETPRRGITGVQRSFQRNGDGARMSSPNPSASSAS